MRGKTAFLRNINLRCVKPWVRSPFLMPLHGLLCGRGKKILKRRGFLRVTTGKKRHLRVVLLTVVNHSVRQSGLLVRGVSVAGAGHHPHPEGLPRSVALSVPAECSAFASLPCRSAHHGPILNTLPVTSAHYRKPDFHYPFGISSQL